MIKGEHIQLEIQDIIADIKRYFKEAGAKGAVVGNSGGKDSAVVIGLMAMALGKENVIAVKLPCESDPEDMSDADEVAKAFGVRSEEVNIEGAFSKLMLSTQNGMKLQISDEAIVNIKPRIRMTVLYAIAQTKGYLVAGTGNKCETKIGYFTKFGDGAYDYNPLGEYTVEEVYQIARAIGVPEIILRKPPKDGLSGKTDEEKLGVTYAQIAEYLEKGETSPNEDMLKIIAMIAYTAHKRQMPYVYKRKNYN